MQHVGDGNRDAFVQAAHGLLFAAAVRLVYTHVQDIAALPLLFTAAAYINTLNAQLNQESGTMPMPAIPMTPSGGGLIASSVLESLGQQLEAQDLKGPMQRVVAICAWAMIHAPCLRQSPLRQRRPTRPPIRATPYRLCRRQAKNLWPGPRLWPIRTLMDSPYRTASSRVRQAQ